MLKNSDLPIACTLIPEELRRGREALLPGVIARAEAHERLADGFRFRFTADAELMAAIAGMIDAISQIVKLLKDNPPVKLEIGGRARVNAPATSGAHRRRLQRAVAVSIV